MSAFIAVLSTGLIAAGVLFFVAGTVGLLRFPDPASRLHALTKADNLGLGLVVAGLLPYAEGPLAAATLVVIWLLVLLASATAGQLLLLRALEDADEERRP
jgi:multicomponent Na+:H+ antiporter subunit G